jgi:hypothetical protein
MANKKISVHQVNSCFILLQLEQSPVPDFYYMHPVVYIT